ncbi:MAG: S16 family serine protease [Candidatus Aenigmatarchaeota archaeon]
MREKILLVSILGIGFLSGLLFSYALQPQLGTISISEETVKNVSPGPIITETNATIPGSVQTYLLAATDDGRGIATPIWVKAEPGAGKVLVDIENLFFWVDTQYSIRLASYVVRGYVNTNNRYNIIYSIHTNSSIVGGPSAGGAMTVATIAAIENRTLNESVVMTGSVTENGRIGRVGSVLEKVKAAERQGFKKILIPEGQNVETDYYREEVCNRIGRFNICRTEYTPRRTNISQEVEIKVVEVENIKQCLEHFLVK